MTERLVSSMLEREVAERLAMVLSELTWPPASAVSFFEADEKRDLWQVEALYEDALPSEDTLKEALALAGVDMDALSREPLPEKDWVEEGLKRLPAVRAGRFVVHGAHVRNAVRPGEIDIEVDAGLAFGTGHHGTTRGCLLALERLARLGVRPRKVLDVGTGSGVLAMAAAQLWRVPVLGTDIDPVAVVQAQRNVQRNALRPWVRLVVADGVRHPLVRRGVISGSFKSLGAGAWKGAAARRRGPKAAQVALVNRQLSALSRGMTRNLPPLADEWMENASDAVIQRHRERGWGVVLANILLNPLKRMAPEIVQVTARGGHVILSGFMAHQAAAALAVYQAWGLVPVWRIEVKGWCTLVMRRPG